MRILLAVSTQELSTCSTQTTNVNGSVRKFSYEESQTFFINGIAQEKTVDALKTCQDALIILDSNEIK